MFKELKFDLPASIIVFFVALPLCLGIALASGAPLFSGIIAGIVGGIFVGVASGSALGVSGPAAGLTVIVFSAIEVLGSWEAFLLAVFLSGCFQFLMGLAKAGFIAHFFPSSVIKGMLSGIGLLIILKQIPHALGYSKDVEGDFSFFQLNGENTFSSISHALSSLTPGAVIITIVSLLILVSWETILSRKHKIFRLIQGPIVVIFFGVIMNLIYMNGDLGFTLDEDQVVRIPVPENFIEFLKQFTFPDFSQISNLAVWKIAFVMAIVASLETLLCVDATDKIDPYKRITPANRELKAQGFGNMISGLIGGLPLTQVIVRSSANLAFGAKTKLSGILHGFFLLISVIIIPSVLNLIPLSSLAAILLLVGYKLSKPSLFKEMYTLGWEQFIPFFMTVVGILSTNLLTGISIGMMFGILFTLWHSYKNSHSIENKLCSKGGRNIQIITLSEEVSFFNKSKILDALNNIPDNYSVVIDASKTKTISPDVLEVVDEFVARSQEKNLHVEKINIQKKELQ